MLKEYSQVEGRVRGWTGAIAVQALLVSDSELPGMLFHWTQAGPDSSQELEP